MQIDLQVRSPETKLVGINAALTKLDSLEQTLIRLAEFKKLDFKINVSAPGLSKLRGDLGGLEANAKTLASALTSAGETKLAAAISSQTVTAGEAMNRMKRQAEELGMKLQAATTRGQEMRQQFGAFSEKNKGFTGFTGEADKQERAIKLIADQERQRRTLAAQHSAMQRAVGIGEAMTGAPAIAATAAAEKGLAAAQGPAIAGMKEQAEIAAMKARMMSGLKKQVDAVESGEKRLDSTVGGAALGMSEADKAAGTLTKTYRRMGDEIDELDKPAKVSFRGKPGETITEEPKTGRITTQISAMEKLRMEMAELEKQGQHRLSLAPAGDDEARMRVLRINAEEMRRALAKVPDRLQGETYVQGRAAAAGEMEMAARRLEMGIGLNHQREAEIAVMREYRQAAHDIRADAKENRGLGVTGGADSLRAEARALDGLRASMALGTPEAQTFARQLEMQAVTARAAANQIDGLATARAAHARQSIGEFQQLQGQWGAVPGTKTRATAEGRTDTTTIQREINGRREMARLIVDYNHAGMAMNAIHEGTGDALAVADKAARGYGRTLLNGVASFGAFVAASGTVYGALSLVGRGFRAFADVDRQNAVLRTVFRGTAEEADALRDTVIGLAAVYGRSASEGMDAAIRWARIGLTTRQTAEAVAVSLQAANVAEITAAQAAEQLAAIYAAFGQSISGPRVALNEMNTVSNTVNATVKDLMAGLARVAPLARQSGLSLAETIGILGAGVARTGQSGAMIGNAMKALISSVSNPSLQTFMEKGFGIEVKGESGDIKDMSTILGELFTAYQKLTDAERQELLVKMGGKQQASRFAAILDGYVKGQQLAIQAQLDLTSADRENVNIRATMISQLATMGTMFDKLSVDMANAGGGLSLNTTLTSFVKLLGNVMGVLDKLPGGAAAVVGVMALMAGRMLMTGLAMTETAGKAGFLKGSVEQIRGAYGEMTGAIDAANAALVMQDTWLGRVAGRMLGVSGKMQGMRLATQQGIGLTPQEGQKVMTGEVAGAGGLGKLGAMIAGVLPMLLKFTLGWLAIGAVMGGLNMVFEYFEGDAEKARRALAGFNQEMETLKARTGAADLRQRLAGTLSTNIAAIAARSPKAAADALAQFADVAAPGDAAKTGAIRAELAGLAERHQWEAAAVRLAQLRVGIQKDHTEAKMKELNESQKITQSLRQQLDLEQAAVLGSSGGERAAAQKRVLEIEGQISMQLGTQAQTLNDLAEADEARAEAETDRAKAMKEREKFRLDTTDKLADAMPLSADTNVAKWEREQQALDTNIAQTKERLALYKEEQRAAQETAEAKLGPLRKEMEGQKTLGQLRQEGLDMVKTAGEMRERYRRLFVSGSAESKIDTSSGGLSGFGENLKEQWKRTKESFGADMTALGTGLGLRDPAETDLKRPTETPAQFEARMAEMERRGREMAARSEGRGFNPEEFQKKEAALKAAEAAAKAAGASREDQVKAGQAALAELETKKQLTQELEKQRVIRLDMEAAGKREAKNIGLENQVGASEGEKNLNEFKALNPLDPNNVGQASLALSGRSLNPFEDQARTLAQVNRMEDLLLSTTERRSRLQADITNERRKEAEEASKALQMGTREEQLRAAGLAKFSRDRGGKGLTGSEFQFLDKDTRDSILKTNPNLAPPELKTRSQEMEQESKMLGVALPKMIETLDRVGRFIEHSLVPAQAPNGIDADRPPAPQINPVFNINMGDQFAPLVDKLFALVQQDLGRVEAKVDSFLNRGKVASAQSAGQLANA